MQTNLGRGPRVWAALLALFPAGCSFAFVDGPPTVHKQLPYFECTSSNVLPTLDAVVGGLYGIAAVGQLASSSSSSSTYSNDDHTNAIIYGALAVVAGASAVYGYQKTSSCREAKQHLLLRLGNQPGFAPQAAPPVDPWLNPPPSSFSAPPTAPVAPPAPTPPGPAHDDEVPRP
jgi:hypothetical protein